MEELMLVSVGGYENVIKKKDLEKAKAKAEELRQMAIRAGWTEEAVKNVSEFKILKEGILAKK